MVTLRGVIKKSPILRQMFTLFSSVQNNSDKIKKKNYSKR